MTTLQIITLIGSVAGLCLTAGVAAGLYAAQVLKQRQITRQHVEALHAWHWRA